MFVFCFFSSLIIISIFYSLRGIIVQYTVLVVLELHYEWHSNLKVLLFFRSKCFQNSKEYDSTKIEGFYLFGCFFVDVIS